MFLELENNSGKLQIISWTFQNNTINDVKQISLSHVYKTKSPKYPNITEIDINKIMTIINLKQYNPSEPAKYGLYIEV